MQKGAIGIVPHQEVVEPGEVRNGELGVLEKPGRHCCHLGFHLPSSQYPPLQLLAPVHATWIKAPPSNLNKDVRARHSNKKYLGHDLVIKACEPLAKLASPKIIVGCNYFEPVKTVKISSLKASKKEMHLEQVEEKATRSWKEISWERRIRSTISFGNDSIIKASVKSL